ncbi:hypothetical protein J41TS12_41610 [Paenibacillus antibioticophila]|uniref:Head-tail adaptor protein n=2 Tax=Paenibacillus antibioticophila TaxID=1274374 RepID=A0A919XYP3_9BACL|nr:hypothetical protein J41TS12_41610 [Paenibacillus antibioticophila]
MMKMAKRLQANDLNRRVRIQKPGKDRDDAGYPIPNPSPPEEVCTVWASRKPLRGRELFAADAVQAEITVRYEIRWREGIEEDMQLVDLRDNQTYEIEAVLDDVFDDRTETHLMVSEASNG